MSNDANRGTLLLRLFRDVHEYVAVLRAADVASATKDEMQFVCNMRFRWSRETSATRISRKDHERLLALAARGGWDRTSRPDLRQVVVECST